MSYLSIFCHKLEVSFHFEGMEMMYRCDQADTCTRDGFYAWSMHPGMPHAHTSSGFSGVCGLCLFFLFVISQTIQHYYIYYIWEDFVF